LKVCAKSEIIEREGGSLFAAHLGPERCCEKFGKDKGDSEKKEKAGDGVQKDKAHAALLEGDGGSDSGQNDWKH
jgi:hypothetical protein